MRRAVPLVLLMVMIAMVAAPWLRGATQATSAVPTSTSASSDRSPAGPIAATISTVTGLAISPLLGTGLYGAYQWFRASTPEEKAALPWYAKWTFFVPALLLVAVCAAKDAFGAVVPPGLKKPLDALETFENKISGLVAAGAVVPFTMSAISKVIVGSKTAAAGAVVFPAAMATIPIGAMDFSWLLNLLTVPFGIAMFAIVWMASHAINVLILLSPWGAIDAALKSARTALLGLLTLSATINPWLGAALSIVVIIISYFIAGWAFRLTIFGTLFCWDFFTLRRARFVPGEKENRLFTGGNFPGVPPRTYGRLVRRAEGGLEFFYRPWLVLPARTALVPADRGGLAIGKGLFFSSITGGENDTLFLLPPRYRGHEETVARIYAFPGGVRPAGLRKAWSVLRDLLGGGAATKTQVV